MRDVIYTPTRYRQPPTKLRPSPALGGKPPLEAQGSRRGRALTAFDRANPTHVAGEDPRKRGVLIRIEPRGKR